MARQRQNGIERTLIHRLDGKTIPFTAPKMKGCHYSCFLYLQPFRDTVNCSTQKEPTAPLSGCTFGDTKMVMLIKTPDQCRSGYPNGKAVCHSWLKRIESIDIRFENHTLYKCTRRLTWRANMLETFASWLPETPKAEYQKKCKATRMHYGIIPIMSS